MTITDNDLSRIGIYVQQNLPQWLTAIPGRALTERDIQLTERIVRVEEELKSQREILIRGFEQVDKRFEQVDKRFEYFETRFTRMTVLITSGFTLVSVLIAAFKFVQ